MRLNIPSSEYVVLRDLIVLSEDSFSVLLKGLVEIEPKVNQLDLSGFLASKVPSINPDDLKAFLRTIIALYRIMDAKQRSSQDIASDVKETIEHDPKKFPVGQTDKLRDRLQKVLGIGGMLTVVAKARWIASDQDRIFCESKVLSDVRYVFPNDPSSVSAAVIVHSLNISYHQDGQRRDFYVALDTSDLAKLKKEIERADKKAITLKALIEKTNARFLEG